MPGATIQIFLPDGNPRGLRLAEITSRTVQVLGFPRSELKEKAMVREELSLPAVYFLIGANPTTEQPVVYVGQAEAAGRRIGQHDAKKDWWEVALVAVSKTNHFNPGHIKYLEWFCHSEIAKAARYALDNEQQPTRPTVSESLQADLEGDFETIRTLAGTLGYPLFDRVGAVTARHPTVTLRNRGADARGRFGEDGLVVLEGSRGPAELTRSARGGFIETARTRLLNAGAIRVEGK